MKKIILSFLFSGSLALGVAAGGTDGGLPVLKSGLHPVGGIAVRDPFIYADARTSTYYLYGATRLESDRPNGRHGVKVYRSRDLKTWEGPKLAYEVPSGSWADCAHGVWAPEMHPYKGKYYLFATFTHPDRPLPPVAGRPPLASACHADTCILFSRRPFPPHRQGRAADSRRMDVAGRDAVGRRWKALPGLLPRVDTGGERDDGVCAPVG